MSKWLNSYDYKDENELVVTITLAEYRELKRNGITVPMRDSTDDAEVE